MKADIRQVERLIALLSVGITVAIERGRFTTTEAIDFLFTPYAMQALEDCGARAAIFDVVHKGSEIEDIEEIIPDELASVLTSLREDALACLADAGAYPFGLQKWLSILIE